MPDRSDEFRQAAAGCLDLARLTSDLGIRAALLLMAQKWSDLANGPPGQAGLETALQEFNERQMRPRRVLEVVQQQQQTQPEGGDDGS